MEIDRSTKISLLSLMRKTMQSMESMRTLMVWRQFPMITTNKKTPTMEIDKSTKISLLSLMGKTMQSMDQIEAIYDKLERLAKEGQPDTNGILADLRQAQMHLRTASEYITKIKLTR